MGSIGAFHKMEKDGKLCFVYHHPKYHTIPQTQSPTSYGETPSHDHTLQPLFLCPIARCQKDGILWDSTTYPLISSPEYVFSAISAIHHSILPLFWCNNKEFDANAGCNICKSSYFGTNYYFCEYCDMMFHKECVQSPPQIKHPYHPEHSLQLYHHVSREDNQECSYCGRRLNVLAYYCTICQTFMHTTCAMKTIPFVIDPPKKHDHPLTFFPRQTSLICNVCGLLRKNYPTYICAQCNFVAHNDCMYAPHIIKISRHHHRISYTSSLPSKEWSCGVCHQSIDGDYGSYTCDKCGDYFVHSRCALGKDVWDGKDLEGVPVEEDITQDVGPFDQISEGVILHFLHDHHLHLEVSIFYDENKLCHACVMPIFEGNFYSCMECDFILHETCAKAHRKIQHVLHPHPLTLNHVSQYDYGLFECNGCERFCGGFIYGCHIGECNFDLDIQCAFISEPFDYSGHEHPLFLASYPKEKSICHVCTTKLHKQLYCIKCDFILCIKCATLPDKARYKHDQHFLRVLFGEEVCGKDWCEVCESDLGDIDTKMIYWCDECCTAFHIECLFGGDPYIKNGQLEMFYGKVQILGKRQISRPICDYCKNRCQGKILKKVNLIACSMKCASELFK